MAFEAFLTAFDPTDLPGSSIDPLGFDRGYMLLAEKILPGLTNVASRPRYFSMLCAAIALSDARQVRREELPRERRARRVEAILRGERFWVLASLLASTAASGPPVEGIRGLRYVQRALARMEERGDTSTTGDFRLLSRQMPYGMVGIYASVADELRLVDRADLTPGPELGRRLGESLVDETRMPDVLRHAIAEGGGAKLKTLATWGTAAHVNAAAGAEETRILTEALIANDVRRRMAALLRDVPARDEEHELDRLARVRQAAENGPEDADLVEALGAVVAFEEAYRLALLCFQRLLWACQTQEPFVVDMVHLRGDTVLAEARARMRSAWSALERARDGGTTAAFRAGLERLADARAFVHRCALAPDVPALVEVVLERHRSVQRSKLHGGRPKMPWLEAHAGTVRPTLASAMRITREPRRPSDVLAHPYRTVAVDRFTSVGGAA